MSACLIVISVSGSRVTNYLLSSLSPQMTPNPQETLNFVSFEIKQKHCDMLLPCFSCKNVKNVFSNISPEPVCRLGICLKESGSIKSCPSPSIGGDFQFLASPPCAFLSDWILSNKFYLFQAADRVSDPHFAKKCK